VSVKQLIDGAAFFLDAPEHIPPVWGEGSNVLWSSGEPFILCGPPGLGKSTIAQQLVMARAGIAEDLNVLGMMVTPDSDRCTLYIAADRPQQIRRSGRRMVTERNRRELENRIVVWAGALPFLIVEQPERLAVFAAELGAGTVVIDSLKDLAMPLSEERVGGAVNSALQSVTAAGIEVLVLHHQRKATADNKKPRSLSDVYGSAWLTAGAGSVALLWGEPGDPVVELSHLKQPGDEVGPLQIVHDHDAGVSTVIDQVTPYDLVKNSGSEGITVAAAAVHLFGPSPSRNQVEKTRRKLEALVGSDRAVRVTGDSEKASVAYRLVTLLDGQRDSRDSPRDRSRSDHEPSRNGSTTASRSDHADHDSASERPHPLKGGGRDAERDATPEEEADLERARSLVAPVAA